MCKGDIGRLTFGGGGGARWRQVLALAPGAVAGAGAGPAAAGAAGRSASWRCGGPGAPLALVVEAAVPVQLLLSRQSFSAAMAGSTPRPRATYEPVPRSR